MLEDGEAEDDNEDNLSNEDREKDEEVEEGYEDISSEDEMGIPPGMEVPLQVCTTQKCLFF